MCRGGTWLRFECATARTEDERATIVPATRLNIPDLSLLKICMYVCLFFIKELLQEHVKIGKCLSTLFEVLLYIASSGLLNAQQVASQSPLSFFDLIDQTALLSYG